MLQIDADDHIDSVRKKIIDATSELLRRSKISISQILQTNTNQNKVRNTGQNLHTNSHHSKYKSYKRKN